MHVELQIVGAAGIFSSGAGGLPSAKRLEARPRAGGGALRAIGVSHAGLHLGKELLRLSFAAGHAGSQAVRGGVGRKFCRAQSSGRCRQSAAFFASDYRVARQLLTRYF